MQATKKTIVKVGQIWKSLGDPRHYEIVRVVKGFAYCNVGEIYWKGTFGEQYFGIVNDDNTPDWDVTEWDVQEPDSVAIPMTTVAKIDRTDELAFFTQSQSGYCPCGIPKSTCDYHR